MFRFTTDEQEDPEKELKVLRVRSILAQAFTQMGLKAYDALLNYGVNYRDLPEYKDTTLLDEGYKLPVERGTDKFLEWMRRVEHAITAAVRRKGFRRV